VHRQRVADELGGMVDRRARVFTTRFSFFLFANGSGEATSRRGPFLTDRVIL
jgi:hypothetical protein